MKASLVEQGSSGKEIRKLNFGKRDTPLLGKLRQVLRGETVDAAANRDKYDTRRSQICTATLTGKTTVCGAPLADRGGRTIC